MTDAKRKIEQPIPETHLENSSRSETEKSKISASKITIEAGSCQRIVVMCNPRKSLKRKQRPLSAVLDFLELARRFFRPTIRHKRHSAHHLADNTQTDDVSERHRLAQWIAKASDALLLLIESMFPAT